MRQALGGKAEGLGVELVEHNNGLAVHSVMPNSPAEKNGIKPKDIILSVNGTELKNLDAEEAANLLIADEGEELTLLIRRKKCEDKIYKIKIEVFEENPVLLNPVVKRERIPQEILYTRIDTFANRNVAQYFHDIIKASTDKKGLIIDLRGNTGGYVDRAATIGNMFLKNTLIVKTIDRNGVESCINANEHLLTDIPIVILVDCESASAIEILAAAMKENERALIVGTTTFGKGIVQKIEDLPNGAGLNFTTKKYLTPKNNDIHKKGVEPDYKVHITLLDCILGKDSQLRFAIKLLSKE